VPPLDPDAAFLKKKNQSKNQQSKRARGCPTSVQDIHRLGFVSS
jgi:hypothetical protein